MHGRSGDSWGQLSEQLIATPRTHSLQSRLYWRGPATLKPELVGLRQTFPQPGMTPSPDSGELAARGPQRWNLSRQVKGIAPHWLPETVTLGQGVGELHVILIYVFPHVLKPPHASRRVPLYRSHFRAPLFVIGPQRGLEVFVFVQLCRESDRIPDRQLGARANREVRSMCGVTHERDVAMIPGVVADEPEIVPGQFVDTAQLADQCAAAQVTLEDLFQ